ncbi:hypothetical protein, partial [Candidatus Igneacidithiobacillus taiwanensis]
PPGDLPMPKDIERLRRSPADYYYGFTGPTDYRLARLGAFAVINGAKGLRMDAYSDQGTEDDVLAMIYANGYGVPRNIPLAEKYACHTGVAPLETARRLAHLEAMGTALARGKKVKPYDTCDDITSGMSARNCSFITRTLNDKKREIKLGMIGAGMPAKQRAALWNYWKSYKKFVTFYKEETYPYYTFGSADWANVRLAEEEEDVYDQFFVQLEDLRKDRVPKVREDEVEAAESRLNQEYAQLLTMLQAPCKHLTERQLEVCEHRPSPQTIRKIERQWLRYREAALRFAKLYRPQIDPQRIQYWTAIEQTKWLQDLREAYTLPND